MRLVKTADGYRMSSKGGFLFLSLDTHVFLFHFALGRFDMSFLQGKKRRELKKEQRLANINRTRNLN